jgi:hypothetical protein
LDAVEAKLDVTLSLKVSWKKMSFFLFFKSLNESAVFCVDKGKALAPSSDVSFVFKIIPF